MTEPSRHFDQAAFCGAAWGAAADIVGSEEPSPAVSDDDREALSRIVPQALYQAGRVTGLPPAARSLRPVFATGRTWVLRTLDDYVPLLERIGSLYEDEADDEPPSERDAKVDAILERSHPAGTIGTLGMVCGALMAVRWRSALTQYDWPLPRRPDVFLVNPANIASFSRKWEVPLDQAQRWVCLYDAALHLILSRPYVAERVMELVVTYLNASEFTADMIGGWRVLGDDGQRHLDVQAMLRALRTPAQEEPRAELTALTSVMLGHALHVAMFGGGEILEHDPRLAEAFLFRRVGTPLRDWFLDYVVGLRLEAEQHRAAAIFLRALVEHAPRRALRLLWSSPSTLPTAEDVADPERWLARVENLDQSIETV